MSLSLTDREPSRLQIDLGIGLNETWTQQQLQKKPVEVGKANLKKMSGNEYFLRTIYSKHFQTKGWVEFYETTKPTDS